MLNKSVYNAQSAPALCVIEEDVDHGTLYISQFVAVCPHSHLEKQSETAIPNIVQSQVKVTVATPPTHIEERPGRDKEDTVHACLLVKALERLAVDELSSHEVVVANVEPGEQCDGPPPRLRLERLNPSQDPLLHVKPQQVMLPVCIRQAEACDPMGMEVVDEVADLFAQE